MIGISHDEVHDVNIPTCPGVTIYRIEYVLVALPSTPFFAYGGIWEDNFSILYSLSCVVLDTSILLSC